MFFITVSNGLLQGTHRKRMGAAVWEFMWLIDKITRIDDEGNGHVLGGKPIQLRDIATGTTEDTTSRNLQKLIREGYIAIKHAPYGLVITVANAKKRFKSGDTSAVRKPTKLEEKPKDEPVSIGQFVAKMKESEHRHINIIGSYAEAKKPNCQTREQWRVFINRNLRPAKQLERFTDQQIETAAKKIYGAKWLERWTMETLVKFLIQ